MLACNAATDCDSFSYNPSQKACFLQSGASRQTCGAAPTVCVSARGKTYSCGVWQSYFKQAAPAGGEQQPAAGTTAPAASRAESFFSSQQPGGQRTEAFSRP